MERRQTDSLYKRESVSLSFIHRGGILLLYAKERVCLSPLYVEDAGSSLYNIESVSPFDDSVLHKRESVSLLYIDDASFFSIQQRERISLLYVEEAASALYKLERAFSSICRGG